MVLKIIMIIKKIFPFIFLLNFLFCAEVSVEAKNKKNNLIKFVTTVLPVTMASGMVSVWLREHYAPYRFKRYFGANHASILGSAFGFLGSTFIAEKIFGKYLSVGSGIQIGSSAHATASNKEYKWENSPFFNFTSIANFFS